MSRLVHDIEGSAKYVLYALKTAVTQLEAIAQVLVNEGDLSKNWSELSEDKLKFGDKPVSISADIGWWTPAKFVAYWIKEFIRGDNPIKNFTQFEALLKDYVSGYTGGLSADELVGAKMYKALPILKRKALVRNALEERTKASKPKAKKKLPLFAAYSERSPAEKFVRYWCNNFTYGILSTFAHFERSMRDVSPDDWSRGDANYGYYKAYKKMSSSRRRTLVNRVLKEMKKG